MPSKTQTSFFRRLLLAHLISKGIATIPAIVKVTGMPRRTAQDTLSALEELDIQITFVGANKNGHYEVQDWGAINPDWIAKNIEMICHTLGYPTCSITGRDR
ncbi:helix-turn-helix domain-containing protein [Corallincola platygyrae]|uniref:Helix-turn-helix domain-containing protein n=1 Tax=Corallincola platygyrae TaxID=1193278 RepID=A0ABW4XS70_9GAMM